MAELEYSAEATNLLSKFHRCDLVVYVEGDDDELFWSTVFAKCTESTVVTQAVGGSSELDKYIHRICTEDLQVVAARDADFLVCCSRDVKDPRVIYTYGYSIENTLYTDAAVTKIARLWSKGKSKATEAETRQWLTQFHQALERLTTFDAANFLHDCGLSVAGDNVARFAAKHAPHEVDETKVTKHLANLSKTIDEAMCEAAKTGMATTGREKSAWVRGHLLASAVLQFVLSHAQANGMNAKISYDALYANAIQYLESAFDQSHPHFDYYKSTVTAAVAAL